MQILVRELHEGDELDGVAITRTVQDQVWREVLENDERLELEQRAVQNHDDVDEEDREEEHVHEPLSLTHAEIGEHPDPRQAD